MSNPDVGPRCGECRLGLGTHNARDPYCNHHDTRPLVYRGSTGEWWVDYGRGESEDFPTWISALNFANRIAGRR